MIEYRYIKNGICYIEGQKGVVVNQQFADGTIRTVCVSCYKSLNPVEVKESKIKRGRKYWGQLSDEKEFTEYFNQNVDRWLHELIADLKGSTKCCIIRSRIN